MGHHIIMGRKTYESIGKALPGRTNIILSRQADYSANGCPVMSSLQEAFNFAKNRGEQEAFVIGGARLYTSALPLATKIYLTNIQIQATGDVKFPLLEASSWKKTAQENFSANNKNPFDYSFIILERGE